MLVTAAGEYYWPTFETRSPAWLPSITQRQFAQIKYDLVEARLVTATALSAEQEGRLRAMILSRLPPGFQLNFSYREQIPRSAGGKYEDFVCEIPARFTGESR